MPTIEVSDHVVQMIDRLRLAVKETEDDVLERVLSRVVADRAEQMKSYEASEPDIRSTN